MTFKPAPFHLMLMIPVSIFTAVSGLAMISKYGFLGTVVFLASLAILALDIEILEHR